MSSSSVVLAPIRYSLQITYLTIYTRNIVCTQPLKCHNSVISIITAIRVIVVGAMMLSIVILALASAILGVIYQYLNYYYFPDYYFSYYLKYP